MNLLRGNALIFGLTERPRSTKWRVRHPPFLYGENMKELSVFVDESGDFGEYDYHAPYYPVSSCGFDLYIKTCRVEIEKSFAVKAGVVFLWG